MDKFLEVNEGGVWVRDDFVSWDAIHNKIVESYPQGKAINAKAVRSIIEELRFLADDLARLNW